MLLAGNGLEHRSICGAEAHPNLNLNRVRTCLKHGGSRLRIATRIPTRVSAAHASSGSRTADAAESHVLRARRPLHRQSFQSTAEAADSRASSVSRAQAGVSDASTVTSGQEKEVAPGVFEGLWQWTPPNVNQPFTIRYQRSGDKGPPALMVHGFGGNWCASLHDGPFSRVSRQPIAQQHPLCTQAFKILLVLRSRRCL